MLTYCYDPPPAPALTDTTAVAMLLLPVRICYQKIAGLRAPVRRKSINLRIAFFGIVKTSATPQWALDSENHDMTAVHGAYIGTLGLMEWK